MAVKEGPGGTVYTGDDVHKYRILTIARAMKMELKGLKLYKGRSIFARVRKEFGLVGGRRSVYCQFCDMHQIPRE